MQTHNAAVTVSKGVNPAQSLMRSGQREQCGLAPAGVTIELAPTRQQTGQAVVCGRDVTPYLHLTLPELAGDNMQLCSLTLHNQEVFCRQAGKKFAVQITNCI
jgi:hypothetical protein